jgi:hypothetical protein
MQRFGGFSLTSQALTKGIVCLLDGLMKKNTQMTVQWGRERATITVN